MPAIDRLTGDIACPFTPDGERPTVAWDARRAPQREQRTSDLLVRRAVGLVVLEVDAFAGAVVLAGGMDAARILKERTVMRERARIERRKVLGFGPARHLPIKILDRGLAEQHF